MAGKRTGQVIRRGDNRWMVRVYLGRDPITGKRSYHNKTIHGTKKDADKYLNKSLREIDTGNYHEAVKISLSAYLDQWLANAAKPRLSERTYTDYANLMTRYVRQPLGAKRLDTVTPLDLQELYTEMQNRGLSARVVRYVHAVLNSAFQQAIKWGMLSRNICQMVELPKLQRREMKSFTPRQAQNFLKACGATKDGMVFAFALATGMRPEEYLALKWSDVDFVSGRIVVQRALVRIGRNWSFEEPKTAQSRRTIVLPSTTLKDLRAHRQEQLKHKLKMGSIWEDHNLVFPSMTGTPFHHSNLTKSYKRILQTAELSGFRMYDLRHSCATLLLSSGENAKIIQERLGHASVVLTLDTYSHVLPEMQKQASEKLEKMLFENVGTL